MPCWVLNMELRANTRPTEPTNPAPITANVGTPNRNPFPLALTLQDFLPTRLLIMSVDSPRPCISYKWNHMVWGLCWLLWLRSTVIPTAAWMARHSFQSLQRSSFHDVHAWEGYSLRQRPPPMEGFQGHLVRSRRGTEATFANKLSSSVCTLISSAPVIICLTHIGMNQTRMSPPQSQ